MYNIVACIGSTDRAQGFIVQNTMLSMFLGGGGGGYVNLVAVVRLCKPILVFSFGQKSKKVFFYV